jgi:hypothetical protein
LKRKEPTKKSESSSEKGSLATRKTTASENERPTKIRRVSSKTVNGLSKGKGPNIRDGSSSKKGRPTRMKKSATKNKRTSEVRIVPPKTINDPFKEEGPNMKDGRSSEKGRPTRRKNASENDMPTEIRTLPSKTEGDSRREGSPTKRSSADRERNESRACCACYDWTAFCPYPKHVCPYSTAFYPSSRLFSFSWLGCPCRSSWQEQRRSRSMDKET